MAFKTELFLAFGAVVAWIVPESGPAQILDAGEPQAVSRYGVVVPAD